MKTKLLSLFYNLPLKKFLINSILMESNPDFCDNTRAVYDKMISIGLNNKYKIIWLVEDSSVFNKINVKNVIFLSNNGNIMNRIKYKFYLYFSKYIIDCNKCILKKNKYQFRLHLTHGTPLKLAKEYCKQVGDFDYIIDLSEFFDDITSELFLVDKSKILSTGFPRNDIFINKNNLISFDHDNDVNKIVFWLPTYRNHRLKTKRNTSHFCFGLPTIDDEKQILELNNFLHDRHLLLLIHLHPAEDVSGIKKIELSNIKFIDSSYFDKSNSYLYQLLPNTDALITDYSSIYYDYLLLDKPIGLAIPDIIDYKKSTGLLFDDFEANVAGEYIYNFSDLLSFLDNVSKNIDISKEERFNKKMLYHKYIDGDSSQRVIDILLNNIKEERKWEKKFKMG